MQMCFKSHAGSCRDQLHQQSSHDLQKKKKEKRMNRGEAFQQQLAAVSLILRSASSFDLVELRLCVSSLDPSGC